MALGRKLNAAGRAVTDPFSFAAKADGGIQGNPFQTQCAHIGSDQFRMMSPSPSPRSTSIFRIFLASRSTTPAEIASNITVPSKLQGRSISRVR